MAINRRERRDTQRAAEKTVLVIRLFRATPIGPCDSYLPGESMKTGCQLKATNQKCQVVSLIEPNCTLKPVSGPAICKLQATNPTSQISQIQTNRLKTRTASTAWPL